jgi:hypothetical protein
MENDAAIPAVASVRLCPEIVDIFKLINPGLKIVVNGLPGMSI